MVPMKTKGYATKLKKLKNIQPVFATFLPIKKTTNRMTIQFTNCIMKSPTRKLDFPIDIAVDGLRKSKYGEYSGVTMSFTNAPTSVAVAIPTMNARATEIIFYSFIKSMNSLKKPILSLGYCEVIN